MVILECQISLSFLLHINLLFFIYRLKRLEDSLRAESVSEETKAEKRLQHAVKETEFLRLKRSRLGVDDFDPLKVIGRGAFGEVFINLLTNNMSNLHEYRCLVVISK